MLRKHSRPQSANSSRFGQRASGSSASTSKVSNGHPKRAKQMLFRKDDIRAFYKNRHVVIIGDSVQRGTYKDLVLALQEERYLTPQELKEKGEESFLGDVLVYRSEMTNGKNYNEVREYQSPDGFFLVQYYFVTRCYNERIEAIFKEFKKGMPDLIIMNSCMWDSSRYGPNGEKEYQENMAKLFTRLQTLLPPTTTFLWLAAMPLASQIVGGFMLDEINFMSDTLRVSILEANYYISQMCIQYGFDVLDLHFYLRPFIKHRGKDGVHWDGFACRHVTDLILTFLHDSYQLPLPEHTAAIVRRCQDDASAQRNLNTRLYNHDVYPSYVDKMLMSIAHWQHQISLPEMDEDETDEPNDYDPNYMEDEVEAEMVGDEGVAGHSSGHPSPPSSPEMAD